MRPPATVQPWLSTEELPVCVQEASEKDRSEAPERKPALKGLRWKQMGIYSHQRRAKKLIPGYRKALQRMCI